MKRMNEVFELPVASGERGYEADDIFQAGGNGVWCATFCSDEQAKSACSAINHVDALADALECLLNRLHYEGCDFADMAVAATALSAYRGGI
jgi:hypothetical protein